MKLENIRARTPDGREIQPMNQAEFQKIYFGQLRMALDQSNAWAPPSSGFMALRAGCDLWFVTPPDNPGPRSNEIFTSRAQVCFGPLLFEVPTGIQPGNWEVIIDLEKSRASVPFTLELSLFDLE